MFLLAGCSGGYAGSSYSNDYSNGSAEPTCSEALAAVVQLEHANDTTGTIDSDLDWLGDNCSAEYKVFTDYASAKVTVTRLGADECASAAARIRPEALALLRQDGLCTAGNSGPAGSTPPVDSVPGGGIAWNEAARYAGTTQRVCGPLAGSGASTNDVFLDLGRDYPDPARFQIVLWDVGGIEPIALGSTLCTTGQITLYNGVAQIELHSASQVLIYH